jgi:hypothetical protein
MKAEVRPAYMAAVARLTELGFKKRQAYQNINFWVIEYYHYVWKDMETDLHICKLNAGHNGPHEWRSRFDFFLLEMVGKECGCWRLPEKERVH